MYLLRRSVTRAIASSPSTTFVAAKPRSITTVAPAAFRSRQQQWAIASFQRRFISDDSTNKASETFAQTATEAPVEENLTPAQSAVHAPATDASATVGIDALEQAVSPRRGGDRSGFNRRGRENQTSPNKTVYVGNLYYEVTSDQLQRVFSRFGEIESITVATDNRGMSRGFAYIDFKEVAHATAAIENLDMQVFEGRNLVVQFHKPKDNAKTRDARGNFTSNPPSRTLFIGNMSYEMSDKDLNDLFRDVRNVMDVRVAIDRRTGQPRGFAHADFIDVASAVKGKEALDGKVVYGRALRIDYSKSSRDSNPREPSE